MFRCLVCLVTICHCFAVFITTNNGIITLNSPSMLNSSFIMLEYSLLENCTTLWTKMLWSMY